MKALKLNRVSIFLRKVQEKNRTTEVGANRHALRDIYGIILSLIEKVVIKQRSEIGFHFYEGLAKLVRKMQATNEQPYHQLWAAMEELRFLFDAHAVWLSVKKSHRKEKSDENTVYEIATLTKKEKESLKCVVNAVVKNDDKNFKWKKRYEQKGIYWGWLVKPLGECPKPPPSNSNLRAVDGILVANIYPERRLPWQLAVFMEQHQHDGDSLIVPGRETRRKSTLFCDAIFRPRDDSHKATCLLKALSHLRLPFGIKIQTTEASKQKFQLIRREDFTKTAQGLTAEKFCKHYKEYFRLINVILQDLYNRMNRLLKSAEEEGATTTLIFSYRNPDDDFISFFPTAEQAKGWVNNKQDMDDFLFFCNFKYKRSKALSGWVLSTGTCDYTENFYKDPRWIDWFTEAGDYEKQNINKQLDLVKKFFKIKRGEDQKFAYLIPIVLRLDNNQEFPSLTPIVMVSITSSKPLERPLRRQLYDQAWSMAPAVEMALMAQYESEQRHEAERQLIRVHLSRALGHSLPKFIFKPVEYYSLRMGCLRADEFDNLKTFCKKQQFFIHRGSFLLQSLGEFTGEFKDKDKIPSAATNVKKLLDVLSEVFSNTKDLYILGRFDRYDKAKNQSGDIITLRDWAKRRNIIELPQPKINHMPLQNTSNEEIDIRGELNILCMHFHNVIENAISAMPFEECCDGDKLKNKHTKFKIMFNITTSGEDVLIAVSNNGKHIEPGHLINLQTVMQRALTTDNFEAIQENKDLIEKIGKASLSEGSGQGLLRFAQYIRFLWENNPPEDAVSIESREGDNTTFMFHFPRSRS